MSDEQQPHRPDPGSGWQPMPHGPEYDAESTAFVQLPPDFQFPEPGDPDSGWDPLAAPGTGYTPPPVPGVPSQGGTPSQGGQWQPAGHGGPYDAPGHDHSGHSGTGHWTVPHTDTGGSGGYGYGGHQDPHGTPQWPAPAEDPSNQGEHVPHTGHWPLRTEEPVDDWPLPEGASHGEGTPVQAGQWTIPVAGDEGVDETGEYRVDDHPGPAAPPYGGPAGHGGPAGPVLPGDPGDLGDPRETAQLRLPFGRNAPQQQAAPYQQPHVDQGHTGQTGHSGQWSVPAADEGVEESGQYAVEGRPGPAARQGAPARRPLRMPDDDTAREHSGPATPPHGTPPQGTPAHGTPAHGTPAHGTPAHGIPAHGIPAHGTPPHGTDGHGWHGAAAGDSAAFVRERVPERDDDRHAGPAANGVLPEEAAWHGEFTDVTGAHTPPHGSPAADGPEAGSMAEAPAGPMAEPMTEPMPEPMPEPMAEAMAEAEPATAEEAFTDAAERSAPAEAPADAPEAVDAPTEDADQAAAPDPLDPAHSEHPQASYVLHVNGADRPVTDSWIGESLLYVLRERLGLAGAKDGCSQGECGACSVQVDGRLVASCLVPAATAAGSEVRTVEGLGQDGQPSDVQRALAECGAVQCGFCVPGLAMTVHDLLEGNHAPTDQETRQALCGNLCRCSGYRGVVDAVREVVASREAAEEAARAAEAAQDEAAAHDPARIPRQAGPPGTGNRGDGGNGSGMGRASA
ncbi:(2Fe-2S)-binding protein [Streptomyces sp. NBRC 110028]|uniref:(2Fe-2S)-binding protein n=1 Tax=Streptomyces sp. NBRC 110028 TaxID=1621260 RepID=UPI000B23F81D|nr:(2Fe-2S)-binding protein [Streptomyces sp. NBRC 110028]